MIDIKTQAALDKAIKANPEAELRLVGKIAFVLHLVGAPVAPSIVVMPGAKLDAASYTGARLTIEARGNSTVTAWGNSTVTARENSTVTARENSTVTAWENSTVTAWENSTVTARENSTVTAWGKSTVTARENSTVTAWENSTVTAWGKSTVTARENSTVTAWENSTVTAWENSTVTARENSTVTAWGYVFVRVFSSKRVKASDGCIVALHSANAVAGGVPRVDGGQQIVCPAPSTPQAWCDHYGVDVKDGVAILYKGVQGDFRSERGGDYTPGTIPSVPVFHAEPECGPGALYFSPAPHFTHQFISAPAHYVGCPVALADIVVHPYGSYPAKVKAKGCCAPVFEVDINGVPLAAPAEVA